MKNSILIITLLSITTMLHAQVSKTISVDAGSLYSALTTNEKNTITNLTLTGTIDASDFRTMRDHMLKLEILDLSGTTVVEYTGILGTENNINKLYPANAIPSMAFYDDWYTHLTSFIFPSSVTSIESQAFDNCSLLTSINIPPSVTSIGSYAFRNCSGLTAVSIPSSVKVMESGAFLGCGSLKSVTIPPLVTSISVSTFSGCGLTSITIPTSITSIGAYAFDHCYKLASINIPPSVTSIGSYAFNYCSSLSSISIPNSVISINEGAFYNCHILKSIYINTSTPINLSSSITFDFQSKNGGILYVPKGSTNAYRSTAFWMEFRNVEEFLTTGTDFIDINKITIYPNPTTGGFKLTGINEISTMRISDLNGKLLLEKVLGTNETVSSEFLLKGVYLLQITSPKCSVVKKLVKE